MTYNFPDHESGDTFEGVSFELLVNGSARSLEGASIVMIMPGRDFSSAAGEIVITDGPNGRFKFAKQVISLAPAVYPYEITITFSNGDVKTWIEGTWTIIE